MTMSSITPDEAIELIVGWGFAAFIFLFVLGWLWSIAKDIFKDDE